MKGGESGGFVRYHRGGGRRRRRDKDESGMVGHVPGKHDSHQTLSGWAPRHVPARFVLCNTKTLGSVSLKCFPIDVLQQQKHFLRK